MNVVDTTPIVSADLLERRLRWASWGTAYFARKLNELTDAALDEPTSLPGWSRRHLVAHVGYNARALCRLVDWAATGRDNPMYRSPAARAEEISRGATLSPVALRNLVEHAAIHLSVAWRDLPAPAWSNEVRTAQGRVVPATETPWMRAREVWVHAVDLGNGGSFVDFPAAFVDALTEEITAQRSGRAQGPALLLRPTDRDIEHVVDVPGQRQVAVSGSAAELCRWLTGRGTAGLRTSCPTGLPALGRWL